MFCYLDAFSPINNTFSTKFTFLLNFKLCSYCIMVHKFINMIKLKSTDSDKIKIVRELNLYKKRIFRLNNL